MLILLIDNGEKDNAFYESRLSFLVSKDEVIRVNNVQEAKEFISSQLVVNGKRVDLIITNSDFNQEIQSAVDLMIWLQEDDEIAYYDSSLLLRSLPVVLMHTRASTTTTDRLLGFDRIIYSGDLDNPKRIENVIKSAIKSWVDKLLGDYSLLHLDPRTPFLYGPVIWDFRCEVLAPGYAQNPRKLPFLIFKRDFDVAEQAINNFYKTVERISSSAKHRQEKLYHQLLREHPAFILGDTYDKYFYEKNFKILGTKSDTFEPDFIRRHNFYKYNNVADVLEIKLPTDKFVKSNKFHQSLTGNLFQQLSQVKDYQRYFVDKEHYEIIKRQLGYIPNMTHSLLLGRSSERDIHLELIEKWLSDFGSSDIVLITYDELIKRREELLVKSMVYAVY